MNCPKCCSTLREVDVDCRQEWTRISYYCPHCKKELSRLITYQPQSSMVAKDEWEKLKRMEKSKDGR